MSMCTADKVYLFSLTYEGVNEAIDRWLDTMGGSWSKKDFDLEIRSDYNSEYVQTYYRACLSIAGNHRVSDSIAYTVSEFVEKYPDIGVEHFCSYIEHDFWYSMLGMEQGWGRHESGTAVKWFNANVRKAVQS